MGGLIQDLRYAARMLKRTPGFTAVVVLTLALGIGANTAIFSLIDALFLKPLPVEDATRLVEIHQTLAWRRDQLGFTLSYPNYAYLRDNTHVLADLAAHYPTAPIHLDNVADAAEKREPVLLNGSVVTWNYFPLLGLRPIAGRFFLAEEDQVPDKHPVAVISHDLWQTRFTGNPDILGTRIRLNGVAFEVVGVMPIGFNGAMRGVLKTDVWIPSAMFRTGYRYCNAFERSCHIVNLIGRLDDRRTVADAQSEMEVLAGQLAAAYPDVNKGRGVHVTPARGIRLQERADYAHTATLLAATVGLVLLTACANVSGLLLARGARRRREIAVRQALGAGRWRLIRQFLAESVLLSLVGGAAGLVVASWTSDALSAYYGTSYVGGRVNFELGLDGVVLGTTLLLSLVTALLFGILPAYQASKPDIVAVLQTEGLTGGSARSRVRDGLIVFQVAVSVVLVVGAGLLVQSVKHLQRGPGFDVDHIALLRLRPSLVEYDGVRARAFQENVIRRLESLPGVVSVSLAEYPPLPGWGAPASLWLPGRRPQPPDAALQSAFNWVGFRYFKTLGIPLLEGREFDDRDRGSAPRAIILSETLARRFWPEPGVVGRTVIVNDREHVVVGVAKDVQYVTIVEPARPFFYLSYWQRDPTGPATLDSRPHIRVAGDPRAMLPSIRRAITAVDPDVPIGEEQPLAERVAAAFRTVRGASTMLFWLGGLAMFLSMMGLYAVLAFTVSQRTREIAIRMALGATHGRVARLVVRQGAVLAGLGAALGLIGAFAAVRSLSTLMFGIQPHDPLTMAAAASLLMAVSLAASYLPARRATRVDSLAALRYE